MPEEDSTVFLWEMRSQGPVLKKGPYDYQRNEFLRVLEEAKRYPFLKKVSSNVYMFQSRLYVEHEYVIVNVSIDFKTSVLKVAVKIDKPSGEIRYYNLTDSGHAVNADESTTDDEAWLYLRSGVDAALRELKQKIDHRVRVKQERLRVFKNILITCGVVLVLAAVVFFCLRLWVFEPQEANNRARLAYNAGSHQIDSPGYPVDAHSLASMSSDAMQAIPTYGGVDKTLEHPRTISISYSSSSTTDRCTNINVDIPSGSVLAVAAQEDSLFIRDHYVATYANRTLTICLVDGFVKNEASKTVTAKLALQAKPQPANN